MGASRGRGRATNEVPVWRAAASLAALVLGLLALVPPPDARAQAVDRTCELALVKADPTAVNVFFPDESASYWLLAYQAAPGTRLRIRGEYPYARYISFNVYDPAGRPLDSLNDTQIAPAPGSSNPFLAGADRTAAKRDYEVTVEFGVPPAGGPAPNTIYTGQGQNGLPNLNGVLLYRVYVPDRGRDRFGDVGLPRVVLEADGVGESLSALDCRRFSIELPDANAALVGASPPAAADLAPWPGKSPPVWRRFVNLAVAYADGLLESDATDPARQAADLLPLSSFGGSGGFLSNRDNDYVYAPVSRGFGQVLVLRGKAPTFADTYAGTPTMPVGQELRYFSLCQNHGLTTRYVACLRDDQLVLDGEGRYTVVVSTPEQRPAEAIPACGVSWLPWGPTSDAVLIYRHMLPDPSFAFAIQRITRHGGEEQVLSDYYPRGHYLPDEAAFDAEWRCGD